MKSSDFFDKKNKKKITQKESWYIFSIVVLSLVLIVLMVVFWQNPFLTNQPTKEGLMPIGENVNVLVEENGSNSIVQYFYGASLPSSKINEEIFVTLKSAQEDCSVRAKVFTYVNNKLVEINVLATNDWKKLQDGYYYLNQNLTQNLRIKFATEIVLPDESVGINSSNSYPLIITFETLPISCNYENIWKIN